ncbi:hypothetical protein B296_00056590 [Ensete ventricosum]|uniref:Uncharacterized protein n=1 Tax=Ensete ventricosum TaxID=4639 RepID=A0A426XUL2_ENSVE|nr:hypothetical protein B296_00056590 [Ensete ventricosum]
MLRNVDLLSVNILTAVKLKAFSGMVYNARYVLQEVVFCVRRCGISFEYTLVLVKNQTVVYHDAEHLRRLQQQSDSRRRAAVMEMMRQRAAEVAANIN